MAIGRLVRKEEAGTYVNRGAICLSACVLVLAGGAFRSMEGMVVIHRPYFRVPAGELSSEQIRLAYQRSLQNIRSYFREMNVAESLADSMLRINPESMRVLSKDDLIQYGLSEVDPIAQETFELQQARTLGLDRQEYMRRKSLAEQQCGGPSTVGTPCYRNILKSGRVEDVDFSRYGRAVQQHQ